jgi:hypothetical protein
LDRSADSTKGYSAGSNLQLLCPRCGAKIALNGHQAYCLNERCVYSEQRFPFVDGQPVLIDFPHSVFRRSNYEKGNGSAIPRDLSRAGLRSRLYGMVNGPNPVAAKNCDVFLSLAKAQSRRPRILVVGGGVIGLGADKLYSDPDVGLVGTDVYASPYTSVRCDAHKLPFERGAFDCVWIQLCWSMYSIHKLWSLKFIGSSSQTDLSMPKRRSCSRFTRVPMT